ncbi:MAG: tetratricopeptide repeat protein [Thermoanaerobaculia bacterium]
MSRNLFRVLAVLEIGLLASSPLLATCGGGGGGGRGGIGAPTSGGPGTPPPPVYSVPWKVYGPGAAVPSDGALTLYWLPTSVEEARKSDLRSSRLLTLWASQCVTLALVTLENKPLAEKLAWDGKAPLAVLVDKDGAELSRVGANGKALGVSDLEKSIKTVLNDREDGLKKRLDEAKAKVDGGDKDGGITLYKDIAAQQCLYPKPAKDAGKALKKLGVEVTGLRLDLPQAITEGVVNARMVKVMTRGLAAEEAGRYRSAESLYEQARTIDPGDPVPLRYLGELYRHHTGEWAKARSVFNQVLGMQDDPISRAVALHGLGKMTIHEGEFKKGLALMERSVEAYPLALAYRNLAVYWNSEGQRAKAETYVASAMALDPADPYNIVFAATYMADSGHAQEALKIASEHHDLLAASYNLAAIYAQLDQREKALALLARHFNSYEKYDAVRVKEKMEAQVDIVFASLKTDPAFIALTKDNDMAIRQQVQ